MRKLLPAIFGLSLVSSCAVTHEEARSLKYLGLVTTIGGGLLVVGPTLNGDGLQRNTTIAGNVVGISGIAMMLAGLALDPANK